MAAPKLTKRDTVLLYVLLTGLLGYGYYSLVVAPKVQVLKDEKARTEVLRKDLARAQLSSKQLQKWKDATEDARQQCAELPLPDSDSLAGFVRYVSGQAKASGVKLTAFTPQPPAPEQEFSRVLISMVVMGGFSRVLDFLDSLNDGKHILVINDTKIDPAADKGMEQISVSITGFTLLKKSEVAPNAVPQPQV